MNIASRNATNIAIPFDQDRVDRAMDDAGLDVLLASSKHNVQYLLGGYKFIFFAAMDAIGHSRYLPVLIYEKGQPEHAGYLGNRMETGEHQVHPFWTPSVQTSLLGHGRRGQRRRRASEEDRQGQGRGSATSRRSCRPMPMSRCATRCPTRNSSTRPMRWSASAPSRRRPRSTSCGWHPS